LIPLALEEWKAGFVKAVVEENNDKRNAKRKKYIMVKLG
jgi:hypothetical protein